MLLIHFAKCIGKGLIFVAFLAVISLGFIGVSSAQEADETRAIVTTDFVDLKFTINKTSYTSKKASKNLEVAPYIVNGRTLVPFRTILRNWDMILFGMTLQKLLRRRTRKCYKACNK